MFCPQCGQERVSVETNYCSRCGFLLTAVGELLQTGGQNPHAIANPQSPQSLSARKRGIKQGVFLFLLMFLVAPLMGMVSMALRIEPFLVGAAAVICFMGGLLRIVYALMFESAEPGGPTLEEKVIAGAAAFKSATSAPQALPPQQYVPAVSHFPQSGGNWRDTNDLQPSSVTEGTTKLLEKDEI